MAKKRKPKTMPEYQDSYPSRFQKGTLGYVLDQEAGVEKTTEARKLALVKAASNGLLRATSRFISDEVSSIRQGLDIDDDNGDHMIDNAADRLEKHARVLRELASGQEYKEPGDSLPPSDFSNAMHKIGRPVGMEYRLAPEWEIWLAARRFENRRIRDELEAADELIEMLERELEGD
jgi:hypothetical protein